MKCILIFLTVIIIPAAVLAQKTINGKVENTSSSAIPSASVYLIQETKGTVTIMAKLLTTLPVLKMLNCSDFNSNLHNKVLPLIQQIICCGWGIKPSMRVNPFFEVRIFR